MGKFSRAKGCRVERELVNLLKSEGWQAERILRQYQVGDEPDVTATRDNKTIRLEMKARHNMFKDLYLLLSRNNVSTLNAFLVGSSCITVSYSLNDTLSSDRSFTPYSDKVNMKSINKVYKWLNDWLKKADVLVLKDDRRPMLFITKA